MGKKAVVGVKGRGETEGISPSPPPSVLKIMSYLSRTMSLIDDPVKVRVKDGSLFSGKFFTASMEGHGIVLKDAELIVKGECKSNVAIGKAVKTLVIRPCHIVEVAAERKGITLSGDDLSTGLHGDAIGAEGTVPSSESLLSEAKETTKTVEDKMLKIKTGQDEETLIKDLKYNCGIFLKSMEAQVSNLRSKTFPVEPFHSEGSEDASEVTSANTTLSRGSKAMLNPKAKNHSPSSSPSPSTSMHVAGSQGRLGTGAYPPRPSPNRHHQSMGNRQDRGHPLQAAPQVFDPNPQDVMNAPLLPVMCMQPMIQDEPGELPRMFCPNCAFIGQCVHRAGSLRYRPERFFCPMCRAHMRDLYLRCCIICRVWSHNVMPHILGHFRLHFWASVLPLVLGSIELINNQVELAARAYCIRLRPRIERALWTPSGFGPLTRWEAFVIFVAFPFLVICLCLPMLSLPHP